MRPGPACFFLGLLPALAGAPLEKTWHTEPSPLLLQELQDFAKQNHMGDHLSISIYSVHHQRFEAQWNDTDWVAPASCLKLVVTAAALDAFPVNYYPGTTLEVHGELRGKTLRGGLRVSGGGDPNISARFFPDALTPLLAWADSLKNLGIDTIRGEVEVSDTFFTGPHRPAAWENYHFNTWYGAEVSALSYNDNVFLLTVNPGAKPGQSPLFTVSPEVGYVRVVNRAKTVAGRKDRIGASLNPNANIVTLTGRLGEETAGRVWLLPVRNPPLYFRAALLKALETRGLTVVSDASVSMAGPSLKTFRFTTAPLIELVEEANQRSQNLHAELLLRHLGKRVYGEGSAAAGLRAERKFLARLGLDTASFDLHDGCGLSHGNRVKPRAMALLLARMARHRYGKDYISSLALPGLDGATGRRLNAFSDSDVLRYKTGTINGVQALSGYLFGVDGDTLAIAVVNNGFHGSSEEGSNLMDSLFAHAARWYNKERPAVATAFKLLARPDAPSDYLERLRYFSRALLGTPYSLGPTGEGRYGATEALPLVDLNQFDCVTYIESSVALALAHKASELVPAVLSIRYHGDTVSYANRNHFFVGDWLGNNPGRFRILRLPGDTVIHKTLFKNQLLSKKGLPPLAADPVADFSYLPYDKALELAGHWNLGKRLLGIAFVTHIAGLDVTHTGFVDSESGKPVLRHASELMGRVVEQDFKDYLESRRGKCVGVLFFEFLPPGPASG